MLKPSTTVNSTITTSHIIAPIDGDLAWKIESLLLKIFEYGDYSFRSALLGEYSDTLNCSFLLAKHNGIIVGVAACLHSHENPAIAIMGPVGVAAEYRRKGIATALFGNALEYLKEQGSQAVYLGIPKGNGIARALYGKFGFEDYQGIVMRRPLYPTGDFEAEYYAKRKPIKIREVRWGDFPSVMSLISCPCRMYTVDFCRNLFSSKYVEPSRFLGVFPEMMRAFAKHGGFANVLTSGPRENIVGIAQIRLLPGKTQRHVAVLDCFVHDNFLDQAESLVGGLVFESEDLLINRTNFYCLACDEIKRGIARALGARRFAVLPEAVRIADNYEDVIVYHYGKRVDVQY